MKNLLNCLLLGAIVVLGAGAASAITVSGIIEEDGPSGDYNGLTADHTFDDFSNGILNPFLTATDDFSIYGSVQHDGTKSNNYMDSWTMDFGAGFDLVFDWQNQSQSNPLDFEITFMEADGPTRVLTGSGTGSIDLKTIPELGTFTGFWAIRIDPIAGPTNAREVMNWQLNASAIAPIPLPASWLLMLAGVFGLVALGKRRKAA